MNITFKRHPLKSQTISRILKVAAKIRSFKDLPVGWHYGEGVPASEVAVESALVLHNQAVALGFATTNAFPGVSGEVQVTIYEGKTYLEFTIEADGSVTFVHEENDEEILRQPRLTFDEALYKIREFRKVLWGSFGSSTRPTMTRTKSDLRASHFETPVRAEEEGFLLLTKNVHYKRVPHFASTFEDTIQDRPEIHQSSGTFQILCSPSNVSSFRKILPAEIDAITTL